MDLQNRSIIEKIINSRKAHRRIKRIIALMAVFVLLMTTDSLKLLADTMESDAALDAANIVEAVDAEQALFEAEEAPEEFEADLVEEETFVDEVEEDVFLQTEDETEDAGEETVASDDSATLEDVDLAAEELSDVSIDEVYADEEEAGLFVDYDESEDILYAVSADGSGFHAEVSGDTGVTLPAGTTLAAQWTERVQGRDGAVAQLCQALGIEGNAFPGNMGAAFIDMALLNGGAKVQPSGNVYVNIDFTEPLHIEGEDPAFRVVTLVDGAARVIGDADYGVTLDGGDVTAIWYYTDVVGETALVWDVAPEAEAEAVEEIPEADAAELTDGNETEEAQIEETTETIEEATDETESGETQPANETETEPSENESETDETEIEAEIADETETVDEGDDETRLAAAPEAEDETGDDTEDEPAVDTETEDEPAIEEEDDTEDETEENTEDETEENTEDETEGKAEAEDNTETENEAEPDEPAPATVTGYANGIHITVTGDVPAEAVPAANLLAGGEQYDAFVEAIGALTDDETARHALAFDVVLTYNNEETQPNGPANVTVAFDAPFAVSTEAERFRLVRFQDGAAEWVDVAELDIENGVLGGIAYTADALTPVAVVCGAEDVLYAEKAAEEPEPEAESPEADAEDEPAAEPLRLGIATVTTAGGEGLPADARGHAEIIDGEDAIASVQAYLMGGRRVRKAAARAAAQPESETRYTVLDIDVSDAEADGYRVDVTLPEAIEARGFRLFHIHDDVEEIAVTLYDAEGNAVDPAATSAVTGFSFITASFSPFVLQYTVDITYEEDIQKITLAFDGFSADDAGMDADSVIRLLNDGVSVNLGALLDENAQGAIQSLRVDGQPAEGAAADYAAYEMTEASGGVSFADGCLRITGDGSVTLTSGEDDVVVEVTGYTALLADVVEGAGVAIDVLEGAVPAGSTASYVERTGDETAELVAAYLNTEDTFAEDGQEAAEEVAEEAAPEQDSLRATGYAAFDVSILQPEGDLYTDAGSYQVTVTPAIDVDGLVPEGAEVTNVRYTVYHIHDGAAAEVPATVEDGAIIFTTDSFSDFIIEYTVEYAFADDRFDLTLNFTGFNAAAANIDGAAVIAALDEGLSLDLAKLLETAEPAEDGETLKARYQGLTLDVPADEYQNIDFASLSQVSTEGGVSYADGRLTIVDDGVIELTDGAYTLRLTATGYADIVWQIRTLVAEGVTIEVLEGSVPETAEASYAPHTAEETAELAETYGIEGAGLTGFDVKILDGGEAFAEPGEYRVTVTPELDLAAQVPAGAEATGVHYVVYHIHDGEAAEVPAEVTEDGALVFTTDSFSDFVVSYTVDFHYAVDGETYEYELTGGGALSLRALVETLRVLDGAAEPAEEAEDAEPVEAVAPDYDAFVANIADVAFSDEALVKPVPVTEDATAGELKAQYALEPEYSAELTEAQIAELDAQAFQAPDWALMSLKPFATDEALTITMAAGEVFTVRVTDAQIKKTVIDAKGDAWEITVTYGDDAQIPGDAELYAAEILPEDEHYDAYYQQASEVALGDAESQGLLEPVVAGARLFDIEIRSGEEKIEPAAPVQVDIKLLGEASDLMSVVHFAEEGPEAMALTSAGTAEAADEAAGEAAEPAEAGEEAGEAATEEAAEPTSVSEVSFKAQAFSVYSVVNVDGNTNLTQGPWALVTGISGDPGSTTGYDVNWGDGKDYFTIIANAQAMTGTEYDYGLAPENVHAWTEGNQSYVGGTGVQVWNFESAGNNQYYMYVVKDGTPYYINQYYYNNTYHDSFGLTTDRNIATKFTITPNSDGTVLIHNGNWYLHNCYDGANAWANRRYRFSYGGNTYYAEYHFRLCKESDAFDSFAARKKAAKDLTASDDFIIYRKFVEEDGSEQLYALASDGSFVRVYDGGDTVYWRETNKNIYWNYLKDGTYYSIFTTDPETHDYVYLNPMDSTHATITTEPSRLTLIGKDNGEYGTAIENWDQTAYDYAGLHVTLNDGTPTLGTGTRVAGTSDEFLFAVVSTMPGATAETVETVDSEALGIHITVYDYGDWTKEYNAGDKVTEMSNVVASSTSVAEAYTPHAAHQLVKPYLESEVPSSTTKGAMTALFPSNDVAYSDSYSSTSMVTEYAKTGVTNLFLKSYYDENGMFRYRSEDNYAYLGNDGQTSFTVYRQAATPYTTDYAPGHSYYNHGHYMPFNQIDMTQQVGRLMNQYGNEYTNGNIVGELPIGDGRSYEEIYGTQGIPNFFTGMKMEATFSQPKDGKLENGDDMIFKFTGDDDMWVYIDGVLVLDVGGIHEPLTGTINFRTGEVTNPTGSSLEGTKTLYRIFQDVLNASGTPQSVKDKINTIQWKDVNGDGTPDTFADYTNHDFKSFYMERGAGASNLDLQFNLKVTLTDEFTVKKALPDGVDPRFINQTYRFRATFKDDSDGNQEKPLYKGAKKQNGTEVCTKVYYKDRFEEGENGEPIPVEVPVGTDGYFTLKAGEAAVFKMADDGITYNVYEVFDADLNQGVEINGTDKTPKEGGQPVDGNAAAGEALVRDRTDVNVLNQPFLQQLDITKHIIDAANPTDILSQHSGYTPGAGEVFEFRVYLESTVEVDDELVQQLIPYAYAPYYVTKMVDGQKHYYKLPGANNAPVDQGTTPVVCSTTGRSGSINSIPPEYTVEIPNLAAGTHFYIEERRDNIPAGFAYDHEELENGTYDLATIENINRIIARDEKDHQAFDPKTVGRIKKDVDAKSHVYNRKVNVHTEKQWLKQDGTTAYTLVEARRLPGATGAVITAELWKVKTSGEPTTVEDEPVTVTFMVNTTTDSAYRQVGDPQTIKKGSTLEFSLGARGTSKAEAISANPEIEIVRTNATSSEKIRYTNGREKDKWSKYTISNIQADTTVYATFDASKVGDDGVGLYIASMEAPGSTVEPVAAKVADIRLENSNDWRSVDYPAEEGYTYELRNVQETGLPNNGRYAFNGTPVITTDEHGNITLAVSNTYREPIEVTVEKVWQPPLSGDAQSTAWVDVELHRYVKKSRGVLQAVLKDNNGAPIPGAVFTLYKDDVAQDGDYTTDVNGKVEANDLGPGAYHFVQKSTPEGYEREGEGCVTTTSPDFTVADNTTDAQVSDLYELTNIALKTSGKVTLTVKDDANQPIVGAKFNLYKSDGTLVSSGHESGADGKVVVGGLDAGSYYLQQTSTPDDYKLPSDTKTDVFTVLELPGQPQDFPLSMTNVRRGKGTVTVTLTKSDDHSGISNASIQLKQGDTVVKTAITENGVATFANVVEGTYTVHQVDTGSAGNDYHLAEDQTAEIAVGTWGQEVSVSMSDTPKGKGTATVTLTRKDNGAAISGATFDLYKDGVYFATKSTGSDGMVSFANLYAGNYTVKQTSTADGLAVAEDQSFTILENGDPGQDKLLAFENEEDAKVYRVLIHGDKQFTYSNTGYSVNWYKYYKAGTSVTITIDCQGLGWVTNDTLWHNVTIDGQYKGRFSWNVPMSITFTVDKDTEIQLGGVGNSNGGNVWGKTSFSPDSNATEQDYTASQNKNSTLTSLMSAPRMFAAAAPLRAPAAGDAADDTASGDTGSADGSGTRAGETAPAVVQPGAAPVGYMTDSFKESYRIKATDNWKHVFENLDKVDPNGDPYYYYVVETGNYPTNYHLLSYAHDNLSETGTITVTNQEDTGDLELTKQVTGTGADPDKQFAFTIALTPPTGQALAASYPATHSGDANVTTASVSNNQVTGILLKAGETYRITGLPADTTYTVTETDYSAEGYASSLPVGGNGTIVASDTQQVTVTNTYSAGSLTVKKAIQGNAADANADFNFTVTFTRSGLNGANGSWKKGTQETLAEAQKTDITFADGTATVTFTLKGGEEAEFTNLPEGTAFTVSETVADQNGYETTPTAEGGTVNTADKTVSGAISATAAVTVDYVNKKETTGVEATKAWKTGTQTVDWPEDVQSVEFTLYAKVGDGDAKPISDESISDYFTDIPAAKTVDKTTQNRKAAWNGLPKRVLVSPAVAADPATNTEATPAVWADVTYSVVETGVTYTAESGKDPLITAKAVQAAFAPSTWSEANPTITNEIPRISVSVTKSWTPSWPEEVASVTVGLYRMSGAMIEPVAVTDANSVAVTRTLEKPATATDPVTGIFENLPKYDENGNLITYSVQETAVTLTNGAVLHGAETQSGGIMIGDAYAAPQVSGPADANEDGNPEFTVANEKEFTELSAKKVWNTDGTHPDEVTFKIYQIGSYATGEQETDRVVYSEGWYNDGQTYTINGTEPTKVTGLPLKDVVMDGGIARVVTYEYHVQELPVAGYYASYSTAGTTQIITNTPVEEPTHETDLDVEKVWEDLTPRDEDDPHANDTVEYNVVRKAIDTGYVPVTVNYNNRQGKVESEQVFVKKGQKLTFTFTKGQTTFTHPVSVVVSGGNGAADEKDFRTNGTSLTYQTKPLNAAATVTVTLNYQFTGLSGTYYDNWASAVSIIYSRLNTAVAYNWIHQVANTDDGGNPVYMTYQALYDAVKGNDPTGNPVITPYTLSKSTLTPSGDEDTAYKATMVGDWKAKYEHLPQFQQVGDDYMVYLYSVEEIRITHNGTQEVVNQTTHESASYSVTTEGGVMTNTEKPIRLQGRKVWIDGVAAGLDGAERPENLVVTLYKGNETEANKVELIEAGTEADVTDNASKPHITWDKTTDTNVWTYTITNLPRFDADGQPITYRVVETFPEGYTADNEGVATAGQEQGGVIPMSDLVNRELTTAEADKTWLTADDKALTPPEGTQITLNLFRYKGETKDETFGPIQVTLDGTADDAAAEIDNTGVYGQEKADWHYEWSKLLRVYTETKTVEVGDGEGGTTQQSVTEAHAYTYKVEEVSVKYGTGEASEVNAETGLTADNRFIVTYDVTGLHVTNKLNETSIHVVKQWFENEHQVDNPTFDPLTSITIQLWRKNGTAEQLDTYTLERQEVTPATDPPTYTWAWDIEHLQKSYWDSDAQKLKDYIYYVVEVPASGWSVSYSNDVEAAPAGDGGDEGEPVVQPPVTPAANSSTGESAAVLGGGTITLRNSKYSVSLPSTGGAGTNAIYAAGAGLLALAAIWFIWDQRRRWREDL